VGYRILADLVIALHLAFMLFVARWSARHGAVLA
jgi:hypothetical protein